jgi:hypothetical protein
VFSLLIGPYILTLQNLISTYGNNLFTLNNNDTNKKCAQWHISFASFPYSVTESDLEASVSPTTQPTAIQQ